MEIKNTLLRNLDPYRTRLEAGEGADPASARVKAPSQESAPAQGDRVSLSPSARLHTAAHAEAVNAAGVRQDKVEALKEQVASGRYTVDSRLVAEKLLESESLLAGTLDGRV